MRPQKSYFGCFVLLLAISSWALVTFLLHRSCVVGTSLCWMSGAIGAMGGGDWNETWSALCILPPEGSPGLAEHTCLKVVV